jgi:basic amino acid/polyamine antiporter, APA family
MVVSMNDRLDVPTSSEGLEKRLGLFDATMLVAGSMIGSGIYIVSADIARDTAGAGWLLTVWVVAGLMTILGALAYAELAAMMPQAGGQYIYLREAYSPLWGFLYGWTFFLVIQTGTIAAVGVAFGKFLGVLVPTLGTRDPVHFKEFTKDPAVLWGIDNFEWKLSLPLPWLSEPLTVFSRHEFTISAGQLVGVAVILLLTWWNTRGLTGGKWVQNVFTVAKIGSLAALIVIGLTMTASAEVWRDNFADPWGKIETTARFAETAKLFGTGGTLVALMVVGGAMVGSLFAADSWHDVTFTAGEVRHPQRNLPLSLILGTGLVIGLYLLANVAYLASLPLMGDPAQTTAAGRGIAHATNDRVGTALLELVSPTWGAGVMAVAIMISTFGCENGLILAGARLTFAMARDNLFFRPVGRLNSAHVPATALWLQAIWSCVLVFSGTYNELLDYVIFAAVLFYALTAAGLFVLRAKRPDALRPYRTLGYPLLPGLYVALSTAVMLDLLLVKPVNTWPGLLLVLTGIPVYFLWKIGKG